MNTRSVLAWLLVLSACALLVGVSVGRAAASRASYRRSIERLRETRAACRELAELRGSTTIPTSAGLIAPRVGELAAEAGLAPEVVTSVSPGSTREARDDGATLVRKRITVGLSGLTLPKLGAFLQAWRRAEPAWVLTAIDIVPRAPSAGGAGGDLPLTMTLSFESAAFDEGAP